MRNLWIDISQWARGAIIKIGNMLYDRTVFGLNGDRRRCWGFINFGWPLVIHLGCDLGQSFRLGWWPSWCVETFVWAFLSERSLDDCSSVFTCVQANHTFAFLDHLPNKAYLQEVVERRDCESYNTPLGILILQVVSVKFHTCFLSLVSHSMLCDLFFADTDL